MLRKLYELIEVLTDGVQQCSDVQVHTWVEHMHRVEIATLGRLEAQGI